MKMKLTIVRYFPKSDKVDCGVWYTVIPTGELLCSDGATLEPKLGIQFATNYKGLRTGYKVMEAK